LTQETHHVSDLLARHPEPRGPNRPARPDNPTQEASRRFHPGLDRCEDRTLLSTLTVTNAKDSGTGLLRATIARAADGGSIVFAPGLAGATIHLTSGELVLKKSLTIDASGVGGVTIDAGGTSRVFHITTAAVRDTLTDLTISGGLAPIGGGILNEGGRLTLNSDTLTGNKAVGVNPGDPGQGRAVADTGRGASLTVNTSTFTGNLAQGAVGYPFQGVDTSGKSKWAIELRRENG
jgi:hypothetical protein